MRVLFLHGLEGSPQGAKAQRLRESFEVVAPALPTRDFDACVVLASSVVRERPLDVVVGSSFGGAVALALLDSAAWSGPTLLLAPAWRFYVPNATLPQGVPVRVVHGKRDELIPLEHSQRLVAGAEQARLVELDDGHRLSTLLQAEALADQVRQVASTPQR